MEKKMPLSLNQRNNNRMIDSTSQLRKPPPTPSTNAVKDDPKPSKLEGRRRLFKASSLADDRTTDDDDPLFSDFDCPLGEESEKHVKFKMNGRRRLCKVSSEMKDGKGGAPKKSDYGEPQFSGLSDFDSSASEKNRNMSDKKAFTGMKSGTDEPTFSILSDFDSPASEKIVSISNSKAFTGKQSGIDEPAFSAPSDFDSPASEKIVSTSNSKVFTGKQSGIDEPTFSILPDFESPTPEKKPVMRNETEGGGNEIRDILDELSSKLNFLSIDKTRIPKTIDVATDNVAEMDKIEVKRQEYNGNCLEYESATSSFSDRSDQSDSALEVTKQSEAVGAVEYVGDDDLPSESGVLNAKNIGKKQVNNEARKNTVKSGFGGKFIISCVDDGDLPSEPEVNNVVNEVLSTKIFDRKLVSNEARKNTLKSGFGGKSSAVDDDDCIMLSRKIPSKNIERRGTKDVEVSDLTSEPNGINDHADDFVGKEDGSITLRGPKCNYRLEAKIATMLYPHQRDGLKWLWSLYCQGKGGILGDDMGLGKTMQMCGYLAGLFDCGLIKRVLIVAPKTLIPHWIKELSAVGLSDMTRDYYGTNVKLRQYELQYILQDKGVLLTTYDIVRNNSKSLRGDNFFQDERSEDNFTWDYMILDEGHLIKNPSTQRAKSLLEVPSAHCIVISGTPIQNNLKELWALFNFCCPELLGDKSWFKDKYESPILRGNDKNASDRQKRIGSTVAQELRDRIQPYFLRRLKSEVFREDNGTNTAKLSKKSEMIVWLKLSSCQQQLYEAFLNSELVLSAFDGSPLAALTILKKICDHPLLLTKRAAEDLLDGMDPMLNSEDHGIAEKLAMHVADMTEIDSFQEKHDILSCKIYFILSLLDNLIPEGHNVLIFSQTRKMLNLIQDSLITRGYNYLRIDGTTKASDRLKVVNEFQEGIGAPIFLLTSQVGGLGLTLTKADRVIVVDPAWNPSTDSQSVDRAYRIGQTKDVIVYRLMTCGTVEEKIYRKQIYKGGLFKSATEHKEQIRYFSQQDLRELFSLPKQGFGVSLTQQQLHEEHDSQHIMEEYLADHIKFLESQGIAGVSHHSLLFSKTAPVPEPLEDEEIVRMKQHSYVGKSSSSSALEHNVDGAQYAFNPKDVKLHRNNTSTDIEDKLTEKDILERINRLSHILADKVTVSKLPDRGARIQNQISELTFELDKIRMAKRMAREVIDLDEITGSLGKVLNV